MVVSNPKQFLKYTCRFCLEWMNPEWRKMFLYFSALYDALADGTVEPIEPGEGIEISPESIGSAALIENKIPSKDGEYIKKHLGVPLCMALAEIVRIRPSDPIHFLGHWLMKWRWNNDEKQRDEDRVHALAAEQKRIEEEMIEKKRRAEARLQKEKDLKRDEAQLIATLEIDRLLEGLELPDLPEREEPAPVVEPEERQEDDDDYHRERDSVRSYDEGANESRDDFYDDRPTSPRSPSPRSQRSEDYLEYDDYND